MEYTYEGFTRSGKARRGTIEALSEQDALRALDQRNLQIFKLEADRNLTLFEPAPNTAQLAIFFRQLGLMQNAGINLQDSLASARNIVTNKKLRKIALELESKTGQGGQYLHEALSDYPGTFDAVTLAFIEAAERGGDLKQISRLADMMQWQIGLNSKIRKAVQQPMFTFLFSLVVMYGLTTNVVPQFSGILKGIGGKLPAITVFMLAFANLLKNPAFIVGLLVVCVATPLLLMRYVKTPQGRLQRDTLLTQIPKVRNFVQVFVLARASNTWQSLSENGINKEESLRLAGLTTGNVLYERIFQEAATAVRQGSDIAEVIENYPRLIPDDYARIVRAGEKDEQLSDLLKQVVFIYNTKIDESVETLTNSINPLLTIFIGVMVALILMSVFLPLSSIIQHLSQ
ncbi:type II secretion system F family protein [Deinococcus ruber]|uniref:Phytochrome sensor protein n=1 Tax=Deinococcus ruber TaxID=1848197 RepID=A0A918C738_9DEIO|nr:type II secretion system F family protein [Deinococcus ruber]GGR10050.1 phytochrome sensor protein [Deinococcus ruber]